ncbi:hypothetical protein [Paenibacillus lautus]|uniref:hypothetical protein n=1 Tax=Paenibacillus lautus TaxID=1401 RepID=UPI003D2E95BA
MKKSGTLVLLLLILLTVTACSGGNAQKESEDKNRLSLLKEAELYIRMVELGKEDEANSSSEFIRKMADGEDKEKFIELADLMDQGKVEEVKAMYVELGGEEIPARPSSSQTENTENKNFAIISLDAAQLYIESDTLTSKENRNDIADLINKNSLSLTDEEQKDFRELAGYIQKDDKEKAKELFQELNDKYGR